MRTYIKKLQMKPENTRKQIFFGSLVVCMSFVVLVWVNTLGYKFGEDGTVATKVQEDIKPFALFGQTITNTYDNVTASVGNISLPTDNQPKVEQVEVEKVIDLIPVEYQ